MTAYEKLGKTISILFGVVLLVVVPLSFFWSSAVRDFALFFLVLAAIFYFEWVASEVVGRVTERLDAIDRKLDSLEGQIRDK
jgi:tetrahydromethanopterin S-methyltransferase subunit G